MNYDTDIIQLLITMVPQQRQSGTIRESRDTYDRESVRLIDNIPLP